MMYPEIPALSFISAALTLVPLIWYFRARNIAAVAIGIWLSVTNFIYAVDALVWAENADIVASVWCDFSTSFITGSHIALPAACLSIFIHLERLASFCQTSTPQAKRRRIIFECLMCFGLPVVYIALHLVVQPRRFDLFYGFGCRPATYPTIATIFLVSIPPPLLTVATIVCAGIAWHHFLVHGVQFYGKRGSISSLTRNLYLRLVAMALLEAIFSATLVAVVMWGVLFPRLAPIGNMSRNLSEVLIWGPDAITNKIWTLLEVEWSVAVVQSFVFFGLFACRMEVVRGGWEQIRSFLRLFERPNASVMLRQGISEPSSTSPSVLTLPITEVDLSLVIQSASTLAQYGHSMDKSLPSIPGSSRPPSPFEDSIEEAAISSIVPAMTPLESPSRASAIPSSHNSLESNFDPIQLALPLGTWPRMTSPIPARLPRRSFGVGYIPEQEGRFDANAPFPRAKPAVHVRSCTTVSYTKPPGCGSEKRQAIYLTVVRDSQHDTPLTYPFSSGVY